MKKPCECCGKEMEVRSADVKRGWGRFCSKSCKAKDQEKRTHQHSNYRGSGVDRETYLRYANEFGGEPEFHNGRYVGFRDRGFDNTQHQDHPLHRPSTRHSKPMMNRQRKGRGNEPGCCR